MYLHEMLYRYFREHPLRLLAFGIGRWRWLHIDSDVDIGQAVVAQTFG